MRKVLSEDTVRRGLVNHKRVQRLRAEDNLLCMPKTGFRPATTDSRHRFVVYPNQARKLLPTAVNQLWVADITYVRLAEGFVYLAVVLDGFGITQFGRALSELNIDIICANSPQAKGRVERAFATLQDRLVKELRLAGISTIAAANAWLPGFMADYNSRFGREPVNAKNLHRPLTATDNLDEILAWREKRLVTRNLTLQYDQMRLLLDPTPSARGLVRQTVEVVNYPDGRFAVQFEGTPLPFRVFDKIQTVQPGTIVDNKRLGAALAMVKQQQDSYAPNRRRYDPARLLPPNNLEAPGLPTKSRPRRGRSAQPRSNGDRPVATAP